MGGKLPSEVTIFHNLYIPVTSMVQRWSQEEQKLFKVFVDYMAGSRPAWAT